MPERHQYRNENGERRISVAENQLMRKCGRRRRGNIRAERRSGDLGVIESSRKRSSERKTKLVALQ